MYRNEKVTGGRFVMATVHVDIVEFCFLIIMLLVIIFPWMHHKTLLDSKWINASLNKSYSLGKLDVQWACNNILVASMKLVHFFKW